MYFTSDRNDGFEGSDLWLSQTDDNSVWGEATNLGDKINSIYDEDAPYLSKDGQSFFFSSNNIKSIGGYDVLKCERQENGSWSDAVNIGYPINSGGDDIYYVQDSAAEKRYFSSSRAGGHGG
jgi:hypothetical protein